ncbi:hypothetical protein HDU67_002207 [Dinochytrium kinnereticum]|nr:hypothetical protein HDU67_002207 [Dinochytrium kinnereticum]
MLPAEAAKSAEAHHPPQQTASLAPESSWNVPNISIESAPFTAPSASTSIASILTPSAPTVLFSGPILSVQGAEDIDSFSLNSSESLSNSDAASGTSSRQSFTGEFGTRFGAKGAFERWFRRQTSMKERLGFGTRKNNVKLEITRSVITETSLNEDGSAGTPLAFLRTPNVAFALLNVSKSGCCKFMLKDGSINPSTKKERVRVYEVQTRSELSLWYTHLHKAKSLSIQPKRWSSGNLWADQLDVRRDIVPNRHPYRDRSAASSFYSLLTFTRTPFGGRGRPATAVLEERSSQDGILDNFRIISEYSELPTSREIDRDPIDSTLSFRTESLDTLSSALSISRSESVEVVSDLTNPPSTHGKCLESMSSGSERPHKAPRPTPAPSTSSKCIEGQNDFAKSDDLEYNHSDILGGYGESSNAEDGDVDERTSNAGEDYSACEDFFFDVHRLGSGGTQETLPQEDSTNVDVNTCVVTLRHHEEYHDSDMARPPLPHSPHEESSYLSSQTSIFSTQYLDTLSPGKKQYNSLTTTDYQVTSTSSEAINELEGMLDRAAKLRALAVRHADDDVRGLDSLGRLKMMADRLKRSLQPTRGSTLGFASPVVTLPALDPDAPVPVRPLPVGQTKADKSESVDASAKKKKAKRFSWIQRDSLARRLFIGKIGSRRRQRYDNNHFVDHPLVDPAEPFKAKDAFPGPPMPRPKTVFSLVPPSLRSRVLSPPTDVTPPRPQPVPEIRVGEKAMTKSDRSLRRELRRARWVSEEAISRFEEEIVAFVEMISLDEGLVNVGSPSPIKKSNVSVATGSSLDSFDDEELDAIPRVLSFSTTEDRVEEPRTSVSSSSSSLNEWISLKAPAVDGLWVWVDAEPSMDGKPELVEGETRLSLVIHDTSVRLIVHTMCRYYGLLSHSEDDAQGRRVTFIYPSPLSSKPTPQPASEPITDHISEKPTCPETASDAPQPLPATVGGFGGASPMDELPKVSFVEYIFG